MALRGNLKDFSLPDVFQLVTFSRKTGVLRIEREDGARGGVWFREGDVFFASSNWHTEPLGERLVRAQRITPQALERGLAVRADEGEAGRRLGQILVDEGYITEKVLESFVTDQIQDTIFDLMRWDEGEFDFEAMPEVVEEDIGLSVSIENIVMEGSRRLEEWNRIRKKIPSSDVVFKMATAPGEGTFEISLKPAEWQLLLLVDGTRSVADLAHATNRTDFEVARVIYGLFSAGLLEFATEEEIDRLRAERKEREARLAEIEDKRRAARAAEQKAALEREAKSAAEARARTEAAEEQARRDRAAEERAHHEAAEGASAQVESQKTERQPARTEPQEVPEFIGGSTVAPSEEDVDVLREIMGAVLEKPSAPPAQVVEPEPVPEPVQTPYVPGEEPAFMGASVQPTEGMGAAPSIEDLLAGTGLDTSPMAPLVEPEPEAEPVPEPQPAIEPEPETKPQLEIEVESVAAPLSEPESIVAPQAEPQLEVELEPAPQAGVQPSAVPDREPELERAPALDSVVEPTLESVHEIEPESSTAGAPEPAADFERDLLSLGLGELPSDLLEPMGAPAPEGPVDLEPVAEPMSEAQWAGGEPAIEATTPTEAGDLEFGDLVASLSASEEAVVVEEPEHEVPDFSALLESLDVDAEPSAPVSAEQSAGFDEDLLREEESAAGGVISTDAFLEDIGIEEMGFSGGMTDELSALTGADRKGPARPQASVNPIPDAGEGVLHRDTRVGKDTLLKIIDGIKNL